MLRSRTRSCVLTSTRCWATSPHALSRSWTTRVEPGRPFGKMATLRRKRLSSLKRLLRSRRPLTLRRASHRPESAQRPLNPAQASRARSMASLRACAKLQRAARGGLTRDVVSLRTCSLRKVDRICILVDGSSAAAASSLPHSVLFRSHLPPASFPNCLLARLAVAAGGRIGSRSFCGRLVRKPNSSA